MDPATATGLALTVALAGLVLTGVIVGVLAWMIRRDAGLVDIDHAIEAWANEHATTFSDDVLEGSPTSATRPRSSWSVSRSPRTASGAGGSPRSPSS